MEMMEDGFYESLYNMEMDYLNDLFGNVLEEAKELVIEGEKLIERLKKEVE
jgi:hypothetical protein